MLGLNTTRLGKHAWASRFSNRPIGGRIVASRMDEEWSEPVEDQPQGDRRAERRHATVLLVGHVRHRGTDAMCLVHDISAHGLMARFTQIPTVGEEVEISVRGLPPAKASVRWVRGYKAGLAFASRQDLTNVLGRKEGKVSRAPRFAVSLVTELTVRGERTVVELVNLSPGGAKLIVDRPLAPGTPVQLTLPVTPAPLPATVCWCGDDRVGLRFTFPMNMGTLAEILALGNHGKPPRPDVVVPDAEHGTMGAA